MRVTGHCLCGEIAFETDIDPNEARICHCTDCQRLSGAPFRVVVASAEADFRLLRGAPSIYVKTAESGHKRQQAFCGTCGSPLYATSDEAPGNRILRLRAGVLDQHAQLVPHKQLWTQSALPWLPELPGEKHPKGL